MRGPLDTREVTFEGLTFEVGPLDLALGLARGFEDFEARAERAGFYTAARKASEQMREVSRTFAGFYAPTATEVERVREVLGRVRVGVSDLKARAVLHSPPRARRRVARLTRTTSHTLYCDDYPEYLEALATGTVKALRARAQARLESASHAYACGAEDLDAEVSRQAAVVAACDLALEALAAQDPEGLRRAERALQRAARGRSHTRTRAYSRPRRRGACSKPSRHLTQAVRRTHAPPPMRVGNHVEGDA